MAAVNITRSNGICSFHPKLPSACFVTIFVNFSLEKTIKGFFDKISHKIKEYKIVKEKEKRRRRLEELERIEKEHITLQKQRKTEEELRTKLKEKALKDEIKIQSAS